MIWFIQKKKKTESKQITTQTGTNKYKIVRQTNQKTAPVKHKWNFYKQCLCGSLAKAKSSLKNIYFKNPFISNAFLYYFAS